MVGVYGNEKLRDQLVAGVDPISNAAVRFTAAKVIDYLSPKGSTAAADELQKLVDTNLKRGDPDKIAGDVPLKQVIYRLRSRAQSKPRPRRGSCRPSARSPHDARHVRCPCGFASTRWILLVAAPLSNPVVWARRSPTGARQVTRP